MSELELSAIDGSNPLAWLAALGTAVALEGTRSDGQPVVRLRWRYRGRWTPVVSPAVSRESLLRRLRVDLEQTRVDPAFVELRYKKDGKPNGKLQRDLKPPPGFFRSYLEGLSERSRARRSLDLAAAFATDVAVDRSKGNAKPTALHFTAGQQQFLGIADELAEEITDADFDEASLEGWSYGRELKTFLWDASSYRDYALRADDPSSAPKGTVPGADWLAFRGLVCLPCMPVGASIVTTLCTGSGNRMSMHWPLWEPALNLSEIKSLLSVAELPELTLSERRCRGVIEVLRSAIVRSDQGYGGFAPAVPLWPKG